MRFADVQVGEFLGSFAWKSVNAAVVSTKRVQEGFDTNTLKGRIYEG